jgi:hypothetical protein
LTSSYRADTPLSTYATLGTIPHTPFSTYPTPGTIPHTPLSTNATPDTNPHTPSEAPLTQSSPRQRRRHDIPTLNLSETDDNQEQRRSRHHYLIPSIATQQNDTSPPDIPSRYTQTFNIMTLVYGSRLTVKIYRQSMNMRFE